MTDYRRNFIPGGSYSFTVALAERSGCLLTDNIDWLRRVVSDVKREHPFAWRRLLLVNWSPWWYCQNICIVYGAYPRAMQTTPCAGRKSKRHSPAACRSASRVAKGERGIWQRRYWEHTLRNDDDLRRHVDYIHYNPVKHGHVRYVKEWPHSTFHRYVRHGVYPNDWAGDGFDIEHDFGERVS